MDNTASASRTFRCVATASQGCTNLGYFFNAALHHLFVAIGEPGLIEVFDTDSLDRLQTVATESGAHTLGFDPDRNQVYAFLPRTHQAAVFQAGPS